MLTATAKCASKSMFKESVISLTKHSHKNSFHSAKFQSNRLEINRMRLLPNAQRIHKQSWTFSTLSKQTNQNHYFINYRDKRENRKAIIGKINNDKYWIFIYLFKYLSFLFNFPCAGMVLYLYFSLNNSLFQF